MLCLMRRYGRMYCSLLLGIVLSLAVANPKSFAGTTQFYSWVTVSGEMVLTDDPGQIPARNVRGPVSVHHFQEGARSSPVRSTITADPHRSNPLAGETTGAPLGVTEAEASDMMDILLEPPEQGMAGDYDWVPLASPAYVGSNPIYGFWTNRAVSNPSIVWKQYLNQLRKVTAFSPSARWMRPSASRGGSDASHKSLRDRQNLIANLPAAGLSPAMRTVPHAPTPSARCCTLNHHSRSGHRSASRR